jgi:hypothetical protein
MNRITRLLTDTSDPASAASRTRRRRGERLLVEFPALGDMTVIDLGGVASEWNLVPVRPAHLTVVNLFEQEAGAATDVFVGDTCELPATLDGKRFDLVFSNSVIDQVGGHHRRLQFAENVHALGDRHWIQTAYRYFPLDAATLFPLQQELPLAGRAWLARHWPLGHRRASAQSDSVAINLEIEGLSKTAFAFYFPDSKIVPERWAGMVKSLIAIRS